MEDAHTKAICCAAPAQYIDVLIHIVMPSGPHSKLYQVGPGVHRHCSLDESCCRYIIAI